jgi:hypothetical protein
MVLHGEPAFPGTAVEAVLSVQGAVDLDRAAACLREEPAAQRPEPATGELAEWSGNVDST